MKTGEKESRGSEGTRCTFGCQLSVLAETDARVIQLESVDA